MMGSTPTIHKSANSSMKFSNKYGNFDAFVNSFISFCYAGI